MDGPDDENPPLEWPKNDPPAALEEGLFVSEVELYRRLGVGPRIRKDRGSIASAQRLSAKGPRVRKQAQLRERLRKSAIICPEIAAAEPVEKIANFIRHILEGG